MSKGIKLKLKIKRYSCRVKFKKELLAYYKKTIIQTIVCGC
ncbi:hypothetical protein [Desulfothermus naphthae]